MPSISTPVYYISESNIEQIYQSHYGPSVTREITERRSVSIFGRAKFGLGRLYSYLTGIEAKGEMGARGEKSRSETRTIDLSDSEKQIEMVRMLLKSEKVKDLDEIEVSPGSRSLYGFTYTLELQLEGNYESPLQNVIRQPLKPDQEPENDVMIRVSYEAADLKFTGVTSPYNWISNSLIHNMFDDIRGESAEIGTATLTGILHPLRIKQKDGATQMNVQYLLLSPPEIKDEEAEFMF